MTWSRIKAEIQAVLQALSEDEKKCLELYDTNMGSHSNHVTRLEDHFSTKPSRYLPDLPPPQSCPITIKDETELKRWYRCHKVDRLLFCTLEKKLGLAPPSALPGDQVWILNGARTPFILRQRDNGNYELIGEAYVHGIVHGEALGLFNGEPLPLSVDNSKLPFIVLE